jgi:hypothetical protein
VAANIRIFPAIDIPQTRDLSAQVFGPFLCQQFGHAIGRRLSCQL